MGRKPGRAPSAQLRGPEACALSLRCSEILMSLSLLRGKCSLEDDISN